MIKLAALFLLVCLNVEYSYSQINDGIYSDSHMWFIIKKGDTAYSENIWQKKQSVWFYDYGYDTLYRQSDNLYVGTKYKLELVHGQFKLTGKYSQKKKIDVRLYSTTESMENYNRRHNLFTLNMDSLDYKYQIARKKLESNPEQLKELQNAYDSLQYKIIIDRKLFLIELDKFKKNIVLNSSYSTLSLL